MSMALPGSMFATDCVKMFGRSCVSSDATYPWPLGLLVNALGLLPLADDAANLPLADGHDEFVDRRVVRQREDVDRLDLLVVRVVILLRDVDGGDVAGDGGLHVGVL